MPLTLLAPALLSAAVPELLRQNARLPALEALCAGGSISVIDDTPEQWLCAQLGARVETEPPVAALRLASEEVARDVFATGYWLCADPIATTTGMDSVRIDRRIDDLSAAQVAALARSLTEFFTQDGLQFTAADPARWYVRCEVRQRIVTTPLWRAIGESMLAQMPAGDDASAWRTRLNEAQMLLHGHPVNEDRQASGLPAVASLWWWGGGSAPVFGPAQLDAVEGGPRWVGAACAVGGIEWLRSSGAGAMAFTTQARRLLHILDGEWEDVAADASALSRWDDLWLAPLRDALASARLDAATLLFPWQQGLLRIELRPPVRESAWRRWFGAGAKAAPASPPLAESLRNFER